jgi:hypothetical protein
MSMGLPNTKSIADFVIYIRERVELATTCWREIAEAFAEAKEMYGGESDAFKQLCKGTRFSKSTAYKLAAIARSERLKAYEAKLSAVHSWGTLYAISALPVEKFKILCERYKLDEPLAAAPFLTQNMVEAVRKENKEKSSLKVYATIYIDEDAMRGQLIEGEHIVTLENTMETLSNTIPYIKVTKSGIEERVESECMLRIVRKKDELARKAFAHELKVVDERLKTKRRHKESAKECFQRSMCMSREELWEMFKVNPAEAFTYLGGNEYDEPDLYNRAMAAVGAQYHKLGEKVQARTEPFKYANTMMEAEDEQPSQPAEELDDNDLLIEFDDAA